jgi:hypothetical protein
MGPMVSLMIDSGIQLFWPSSLPAAHRISLAFLGLQSTDPPKSQLAANFRACACKRRQARQIPAAAARSMTNSLSIGGRHAPHA